jgi:rhomboid-like protein
MRICLLILFLPNSLLGPASFLGLYLGGGIVSSMVSLVFHRVMSNNRSKTHGSEGASGMYIPSQCYQADPFYLHPTCPAGAIYASLAYYAAMFPQAQFLLFFVVPMPAWAAVGGIFAVSYRSG